MSRPIDQRLQKAGKARREAEARRSATAKDLRGMVQAAAELGYTPTAIAKIAGISRQTVHEMLKD